MTQNQTVAVPPFPLTPKQDRRRAVLLLVLAISLLATMDMIVKFASLTLSTNQIVWGRYVGQCVALILVLGPSGIQACMRSKVPGLHVLRALFLFAANFAFMASLRYLPLAEANVVAFASPLLLTALTYPVLGEHVGINRWSAVFAGFIGVVIVVQPGTSIFQWAAVLPLIMAIFGASYHVMTPIVARVEDPALSIYFLSIIGSVSMSIVVPWSWVHPDALGWLMLFAIGACGTIGHILIVRGFAHAPTSLLAPFFYVHLIWAIIYGWLVFGDVPAPATMIGGALVIASGLYVYRAK
jgi:drug/metabolite transporter (DMT)-like permease